MSLLYTVFSARRRVVGRGLLDQFAYARKVRDFETRSKLQCRAYRMAVIALWDPHSRSYVENLRLKRENNELRVKLAQLAAAYNELAVPQQIVEGPKTDSGTMERQEFWREESVRVEQYEPLCGCGGYPGDPRPGYMCPKHGGKP